MKISDENLLNTNLLIDIKSRRIILFLIKTKYDSKMYTLKTDVENNSKRGNPKIF